MPSASVASCTADADADGICDDVDDCVGALDACGVCNGPGEIYECGCADIPEGDCDCDGNQLDALGVCGGTCAADADADGICDDVDDCVGALDACGVCNGPGEIYECGCTDIPEGDCDCDGNQLDALGVCGGDCISDTDGDGVCDTDEIGGCTDGAACNFDPTATDDDGSCTYSGPPSWTAMETASTTVMETASVTRTKTNARTTMETASVTISMSLAAPTRTRATTTRTPRQTMDPAYAANGFNCDGTSINGSNSFAGAPTHKP